MIDRSVGSTPGPSLISYAFLIAADHEMYAVEPGWRLFAVDLCSGAAYESHGGFNTESEAIACRDAAIASGVSPADDDGSFCRLRIDAQLAAFKPDPDHGQ